jgi:hypothetical protein
VGVFEHVQGLDHPAELGQSTGEAGGAGAITRDVYTSVVPEIAAAAAEAVAAIVPRRADSVPTGAERS